VQAWNHGRKNDDDDDDDDIYIPPVGWSPCGLGETENRPTAPMQIVKGDQNKQLRKDQGITSKDKPPHRPGYDIKLHPVMVSPKKHYHPTCPHASG